MLDIHARRLDRAARKAAHLAVERDEPLCTLPAPEILLAGAEARDGCDRFALAGIGRIVEFLGYRN